MTEPQTPAPDAPPADPAPPAPTPTPPAPKPPSEPVVNPWDDPAAAKSEIERLRRENGAARTNAKEAAATEARNELAQTIGKAIGLVEDEPIDPAKLTASLTTAQAEAKQARVELAVFRNADKAGGDPAALLDSSSFLKSLESVDPKDAAAVQTAISTAVDANKRLGVAPNAPRTPAPNPAQGAGGGGVPSGVSQLTEADVKRLSDAGDHAAIVKAKSEGRLATYLSS